MASGIKFEDFDPNQPDYSVPVWGVYGEYTGFKTYSSRGPALNRLTAHGRGKLYEFDPSTGKWIERVVKDAKAHGPTCDHCHFSTMEPVRVWDYQKHQHVNHPTDTYDGGSYRYRRNGGKVTTPVEALFLCTPCRNHLNW